MPEKESEAAQTSKQDESNQVTDEGFNKINTSGTNNWCGYFALANCIFYQNDEVKNEVYKTLGIETKEKVDTEIQTLQTEFDKNDNNSEFTKKTGFTKDNFKKLKELYEEDGLENFLSKLHEKDNGSNKNKLYESFIGYLIRKKYIDEWKQEHIKETTDSLMTISDNNLDIANLLLSIHKSDGLFADNNIAFDQIAFLAKNLHSSFVVKELRHYTNGDSTKKCNSTEVYNKINDNFFKYKKTLLTGFLSATDSELEEGNFTITENLSKEGIIEKISSKHRERLEDLEYSKTLINLFSKIQNDKNRINELINEAKENLSDNIKQKLDEIKSYSDFVTKLLNVTKNHDLDIESINSNHHQIISKLDKKIEDFKKSKEQLCNNHDLISFLESISKEDDKSIKLILSNPNIHHYDAMISDQLFKNFKSDQFKLTIDSDSNSLDHSQQKETNTKSDHTRIDFSRSNSNIIVDFYRILDRSLSSSQSQSSNNTEIEQIKELFKSFQKNDNLGDLTELALKYKFKDLYPDINSSKKNYSMLDFAIDQKNYDIANFLVDEINRTNNEELKTELYTQNNFIFKLAILGSSDSNFKNLTSKVFDNLNRNIILKELTIDEPKENKLSIYKLAKLLNDESLEKKVQDKITQIIESESSHQEAYQDQVGHSIESKDTELGNILTNFFCFNPAEEVKKEILEKVRKELGINSDQTKQESQKKGDVEMSQTPNLAKAQLNSAQKNQYDTSSAIHAVEAGAKGEASPDDSKKLDEEFNKYRDRFNNDINENIEKKIEKNNEEVALRTDSTEESNKIVTNANAQDESDDAKSISSKAEPNTTKTKQDSQQNASEKTSETSSVLDFVSQNQEFFNPRKYRGIGAKCEIIHENHTYILKVSETIAGGFCSDYEIKKDFEFILENINNTENLTKAVKDLRDFNFESQFLSEETKDKIYEKINSKNNGERLNSSELDQTDAAQISDSASLKSESHNENDTANLNDIPITVAEKNSAKEDSAKEDIKNSAKKDIEKYKENTDSKMFFVKEKDKYTAKNYSEIKGMKDHPSTSPELINVQQTTPAPQGRSPGG